ncbi:hypothetical protein KRMM14A1259_22320 [Krasilnikovia sp. MM14-A1259]
MIDCRLNWLVHPTHEASGLSVNPPNGIAAFENLFKSIKAGRENSVTRRATVKLHRRINYLEQIIRRTIPERNVWSPRGWKAKTQSNRLCDLAIEKEGVIQPATQGAVEPRGHTIVQSRVDDLVANAIIQ